MSDLISTQEAVAKIVDTAIQKILSGEQKLTKEYEQTVIEAVNVILNTAQHEIVRCKDCKWFGDIGCAIRIDDDTDKPTEDDYCSFAERRAYDGFDFKTGCNLCARRTMQSA